MCASDDTGGPQALPHRTRYVAVAAELAGEPRRMAEEAAAGGVRAGLPLGVGFRAAGEFRVPAFRPEGAGAARARRVE